MAASRSSRYSGSDSTSEFLMQVELSVLDTTIVMVFADMGPPDGPVIICIHGSPATYRAYHTMFQPLTEAGMRLVIPNFPGMGYTNVDDKENFNFSPQHKAEVVKALIQKLKLERVEMIIGHSMGGHLAALVAATDNNNIIKSVCFLAGPGVTPHYYPFNSTYSAVIRFSKTVGWLIYLSSKVPLFRYFVQWYVKLMYAKFGLGGRTPQSNVNSVYEGVQMDFKQFHVDIDVITKRNLPVLVIYSENDGFIRPAISEEFIGIMGLKCDNATRYDSNGKCIQKLPENELRRVVAFEKGGHRPHWKFPDQVITEILLMLTALKLTPPIFDKPEEELILLPSSSNL